MVDHPPAEQRRFQGRTAPTDASRRADAQGHLDGRLIRLQAWEASLESALAAGPRDDRRVQIENQLAQVRRDLLAAGRPRLPKEKPPRPVPTAAAEATEADQEAVSVAPETPPDVAGEEPSPSLPNDSSASDRSVSAL